MEIKKLNKLSWLLLLIIWALLLFLAMSACTKPVTVSDSSKVNQRSDTIKTQVSVTVPGSKVTVNVNIDSLLKNSRVSGKPIYIQSQDGRASLQIYLDAMGRLTANCAAKDTTIQYFKILINQLLERERTVVQEQRKSGFANFLEELQDKIFWILGAIMLTYFITRPK